jgi:hypothetical protein
MPAIEDLMRWQSVALEGVTLSLNPSRAEVRGVAVTDFYTRVILEADGALNLTQLGKQPQEGPLTTSAEHSLTKPLSTAAPARSAFPVTIDTMTLQGGHLSFTDKSVAPNYHARITELAGRVSGLSSDADSLATWTSSGSSTSLRLWRSPGRSTLSGTIST